MFSCYVIRELYSAVNCSMSLYTPFYFDEFLFYVNIIKVTDWFSSVDDFR